ncbi:MAG: PhoPQ-activated pathogenicity-related protein [bacterium ADurb.Bin429]|nr:MAG: PhoPQ-activated pathogenicity-related protein [bacterium ADurb.Bin429]
MRSPRTGWATPRCLWVCLLICGCLCAAQAADPPNAALKPLEPVDGKVGIFDLPAIRAVPMDVEIVKKTVEDGIAIEEIRFTSRPGVRALMILTYAPGKFKRPVSLNVRNYGVATLKLEAKNTFVGVSVCPTSGNSDPTKRLTVGGPPFNQFYTDDPEQSWYYHHVVALLRAIDYICTRPEADPKNIMVQGYSTSGYVVNLLHAIDSRPVCYYTWHGTGHYTDPQGMSGGKSGIITRKQYEMYGPAAYAKYGSSPLYIANALNDYYAVFDGLLEIYSNLRCPKGLALAPNRGHKETSRNELRSAPVWCARWQFNGPTLPVVHDGTVSVKEGQFIYQFTVTSSEQPKYADVFYSYGEPGRWVGRTWHRGAATKVAHGIYALAIPIYDPAVPLYAAAQIETNTIGVMANIPQYFEPVKLGISRANAVYPHMLHDFEEVNDLYIPVGTARYDADAPQGKFAAAITPFADGTVQLVNVEPFLWKGAKELRFYLKGDGKPGPVDLYVTNDRNYWDFPKITLVQPEEPFAEGWHEYAVPLDAIANLSEMTTLVFTAQYRQVIYIDAVRWQ